jgi:hypothetical protein
MNTYTYGRSNDQPDAGWNVKRNGVPILALPPELPELIVGAIRRTIEYEVQVSNA